MKRVLLVLTISLLTVYGFSQENLLSISGGYSFANVDDSDAFSEDPNIKGPGWRINGTYDFNPNQGKVAYGFSVGYISVKAEYDADNLGKVDYEVSTIPIYFAPKFLFGNNKTKGFVKGALGVQSAKLNRSSSTGSTSGSDFGFYGGGGAGLMYFVNDKIFLNAEYEIAYMTNAYYRNGLMNTVMGGIGIKF